MADTKITALTALTAADPANDVIPIVDVSDTTMAASGTTKKISVNNILGASGTATLASATINGDLTVDTTTLVVDATNNRVGIGTAGPANKLVLVVTPPTSDSDGLVINGPSSRQIIAGMTGATFSYLGAGANQNLLYAANGQLNILGDGQNVRIATSGSSYLTLDTSANVTVGGGNVVMATSGKGIDFSATANSSGTMTSELLNDYEEGTFTIGLTFGGASTGITTNANEGKYTKIGRQVTVTGYLSLTNKGSATGDALITGLPFLINSYGGLSIYLAQITFADFPMGYSNNGTSTIPLRECTNAGVASSLTDADFANNSEIIFTMTYTVA